MVNFLMTLWIHSLVLPLVMFKIIIANLTKLLACLQHVWLSDQQGNKQGCVGTIFSDNVVFWDVSNYFEYTVITEDRSDAQSYENKTQVLLRKGEFLAQTLPQTIIHGPCMGQLTSSGGLYLNQQPLTDTQHTFSIVTGFDILSVHTLTNTLAHLCVVLVPCHVLPAPICRQPQHKLTGSSHRCAR